MSREAAPASSDGSRSPGGVVAGIFIAALLLRLAFLSGVLSAHDAGGLGHLSGDSTEYLHLGLNLAGGEGYTTDHIRSRLKALARPPLYPVLLAAPVRLLGPEATAEQAWAIPPDIKWRIAPDQGYDSEFRLTERMRAPLIATFLLQAMGDALLAALAASLAWRLTRSLIATGVVGGAMALNIAGIGLSSAILADGLFALLCFGALYATIGAANRVRSGCNLRSLLIPAVAAGGLWAAAQLTKPALTFWPAGLAIGWIILCGRHTITRRGFLSGTIIFGGLVAALGGWTLRNYVVEGLATPSSITERNLRYMIQPDVAVWADFGRKPGPSERSRYYWRYAKRDLGMETAPGMTAGEWVRGQRYRAMEVLRLYPSLVVKVYLRNIENVITDPWDLYYEQVPTPGSPYAPDATPNRWTAVVRTALYPLQLIDQIKPLHWGVAALALTSPFVWLVAQRRRKRPPSPRGDSSPNEAGGADGRTVPPPRCEFAASAGGIRPLLLLWGFCLYLVLLSGTTRNQGSRILYPAHAPAAVLVACAAAAAIRRPSRHAKTAPQVRGGLRGER